MTSIKAQKTSTKKYKKKTERLSEIMQLLESKMEVTSYSAAKHLNISQRHAYNLLVELVQEGRAVAELTYHRPKTTKWIVRIAE